LSAERREEDLVFLARRDNDAFARWEALNELYTSTLIKAFRSVRGQMRPLFDRRIPELVNVLATDQELECAYRALALTLPSENDIAREIGSQIDPDAIRAARDALVVEIASSGAAGFARQHDELRDEGPFS